MNQVVTDELIDYINCIIRSVNYDSKTANHWFRLGMRLKAGKKLTKKMEQNLSWIKKDIENGKKLYKMYYERYI